MKLSIYTVLFALAIGFTQCCKEKPTNRNDNNIPGLPPATQTGANTLGFLLNGVPWVPEGPNNLSMDYDPGFNDGILGIVGYRRISINNSTQFLIGIRDSLNHIDFSKEIKIGRGQPGYIGFSDTNFCSINQNDLSTFTGGGISIKLDTINNIISGKFWGVLFNQICGDTLRITNGRFDMKF